jgi:hypothetical protein
LIQIGKKLACCIIFDESAHRDPNHEIRSTPPVLIFSLPMRAVPSPVKLLILTIQEGIKGIVGHEQDITALPPIAAIRTAFRNVRLPSETQTAPAACSRKNGNTRLVYKFQNGVTASGKPVVDFRGEASDYFGLISRPEYFCSCSKYIRNYEQLLFRR